ncbi:MAG: tRNA pseudouridine(55) synthase TruB [Methylocystaceae bacterium]
MNGFINIDKSSDMTSFDVIRELRRKLQVKKMGHLGTLDPLATGVLPIAVGNTTRLISFIEADNKCYRSRGRLGKISATQDVTGELTIIKRNPVVDREKLILQLQQMTGKVMQKPPMYSAVHHNGQRLYELARQGVTVDVPTRMINIYRMELLGSGNDEEGPWVDLEIECSRGTYIRTIWHDLGQALGCGAYMEQLQRTQVGPFHIEQAISLEKVSSDCLLPPDYPFADWQDMVVEGLAQNRISNGNTIAVPSNLGPGKAVIKDQQGELIALGEITAIDNEMVLRPWRVIPQASKG